MSCIVNENINQVGNLLVDYSNIDVDFLKEQNDLNLFIQVNERNQDKKYVAFGDNAENNILIGGDCTNDRLVGKEGNDLLVGGKETSAINAGAGCDTVYLMGNSYVTLGEGKDILSLEMFEGTKKNAEIKDFKLGEDKLIIRNLEAGENVYIQRGELFIGTKGTNIEMQGINESKERLFLEEGIHYEIF